MTDAAARQAGADRVRAETPTAPSANDGRRLEATTPARIARQSWALAASCAFRRDDCASLSISRLGAILGGALQRMREVQRTKGGQAEGHREIGRASGRGRVGQ